MRVGVVGLGQIGGGLARSLLSHGMDVSVCDVRPEATGPFADAARVCPDVASLAGRVDVVLVAVVDDRQATEVLSGPDGGLAHMASGAAAVVVSTISAATLDELGREAASVGVELLDCGVTGGPIAAAEGKLVSMVGGSDAGFAAVRPTLDAFSSLVVRVGPLGSGMRAKLARQLAQFGAWLAAHEAARLAETAGIDPRQLGQVIKAGDALTGGSAALLFRPTTAPWSDTDDRSLVQAMRTAAALARKDVTAAAELAGDLGLRSPLLDLLAADIDTVFGFEL